jgi:hypothetical protein
VAVDALTAKLNGSIAVKKREGKKKNQLKYMGLPNIKHIVAANRCFAYFHAKHQNHSR